MKHKTADIEGALLDAAVAMCEGYVLLSEDETRAAGFTRTRRVWRPPVGAAFTLEVLRYSESWQDGGPIIERERITIAEHDSGGWVGIIRGVQYDVRGATHLIAAMRAYVASKFGDEVDLP